MDALYADNIGMKMWGKMFGYEHWSQCSKCESVTFDCHSNSANRQSFLDFQRTSQSMYDEGPSKKRKLAKGPQSDYSEIFWKYI